MDDYSEDCVLMRKAMQTLDAELLNEFWDRAALTAERIREHATNLAIYARERQRRASLKGAV